MTTPTNSLRCGVIGLGIGRKHIEGYREHPACQVVAVADPDEDRLARARDEWEVPATYADSAAMLATEALDVVSIATPNNLHLPLTLQALEAGCHVLCEKPLAMNCDEGRQMIAAAERCDRRLMINFSYRFTDSSQALKRLVDTGVLGPVYSARSCWLRRCGFPGLGGWFSDRARSGGGPLIDLGVHRLDLALWLMGYPRARHAIATTSQVLTERQNALRRTSADVEHHASGMIVFETGASLQLEASWACHRREAEFMETQLYGSDAGLVQKNLDGTYRFTAELYQTRDGAHYTTVLDQPVEPAKSSMACFADAILGDQPTPAPAEEGLIVQEILDALYTSAARGGEPISIGG